MSPRFIFAVIAALSAASLHAAPRPRNTMNTQGGLSQAEEQAAGVVIDQTARGGSAVTPATPPPGRRYSPDYYRVYHQRIQAQAAARKKVATAAPAPRPAATPAPRAVARPAPVPTPAPVAKARPTPVPRLVALKPTPVPKPAPAPARHSARRSAAAPAPTAAPRRWFASGAAATPAPASKARGAQRPPLRVAVMPQDAAGTIYLPVNSRGAARAKSAPARRSKAAAATPAPKRTLFQPAS